jgi:PIN domain nuclease of toxin-antitoxin system
MILLDTHVWLWLNSSTERIPPSTLAVLTDPDMDLYLSVASAWEIAIKYSSGKLPLPLEPALYISSRIAENGVRPLPIRLGHTFQAAALPLHHRDPFDRMLIAQAQIEGLPLATADPVIASYDVSVLWAQRDPPATGG